MDDLPNLNDRSSNIVENENSEDEIPDCSLIDYYVHSSSAQDFGLLSPTEEEQDQLYNIPETSRLNPPESSADKHGMVNSESRVTNCSSTSETDEDEDTSSGSSSDSDENEDTSSGSSSDSDEDEDTSSGSSTDADEDEDTPSKNTKTSESDNCESDLHGASKFEELKQKLPSNAAHKQESSSALGCIKRQAISDKTKDLNSTTTTCNLLSQRQNTEPVKKAAEISNVDRLCKNKINGPTNNTSELCVPGSSKSNRQGSTDTNKSNAKTNSVGAFIYAARNLQTSDLFKGLDVTKIYETQVKEQKLKEKKQLLRKHIKHGETMKKGEFTQKEAQAILMELNLDLQKLRQRDAADEDIWEKAEQFGDQLLDAMEKCDLTLGLSCAQDENHRKFIRDWSNTKINTRNKFLEFTTPNWVVLEFLREKIKGTQVKLYNNQDEYDTLVLPNNEKIQYATLEPRKGCGSCYHAIAQNLFFAKKILLKKEGRVYIGKTFEFINIMKALVAYDIMTNTDLYEQIFMKHKKHSTDIIFKVLSRNQPADEVIINCMAILLEKPIRVYHRYSDKPEDPRDTIVNITEEKIASESSVITIARRYDTESTEEYYVAILKRDKNGVKRKRLEEKIDWNQIAETYPEKFESFTTIKAGLAILS